MARIKRDDQGRRIDEDGMQVKSVLVVPSRRREKSVSWANILATE